MIVVMIEPLTIGVDMIKCDRCSNDIDPMAIDQHGAYIVCETCGDNCCHECVKKGFTLDPIEESCDKCHTKNTQSGL